MASTAGAGSGSIAWTYIAEPSEGSDQLSAQDIRAGLEKGTDDVKLQLLRHIITSTLNGTPYPTLLMPIIQFVLPSKDKRIKKLLHFYWEVCPKLDESGKLKQEMILVCNAIRNDLQHPNEYIRGATLRHLQKIKETELLEPLIPTARACLEHRHSFVRKNAVFAIMQIYKTHEHLIPDAPELIQTFLIAESDATCKRNAFVMLISTSPERAYDYFVQNVYDNVAGADELMQLGVIELVRKEGVKAEGAVRSRYIRSIFELLNSTSNVVKYEAATTLTILTQNPAAVKAAASAFIDLIIKESDNNVKLIVLDRVDALKSKHEHVLNDLVMDLLRVLAAQDMDVKKKALATALDLVSGRNVEEVVLLLKKELTKTLDQTFEKNLEYRQLLIQSIHTCAIKFSEVASNVVHVLMDFLGDSNNTAAVDVIAFVREVVERFPDLRSSIVERLLQTFGDIKSGKVFRGALWIVGEYGTSAKDMKETMQQIRKVLGEIPILASEQRLLEQAEAEAAVAEEAAASAMTNGSSGKPKASSTTKVLADGTYATETAYSSNAAKEKLDAVKNAKKPPLRALILGGDYYTGTVLAATLTKLVLRYAEVGKDVSTINALRAEAMLIMTSIIRVGQSQFVTVPIDEDSAERISTCLQSLVAFEPKSAEETEIREIFLQDTQAAYSKMVAHEEKKAAEKRAKENKASLVQPDDLVSFRQFAKKNAGDADEYESAMTKATGSLESDESLSSKLSRVVQLTGFSDPVYAEAYVNVHQFDINMDVLVVNQTSETLQNMSVEFATLGDLKLVERPLQYTLGPHSFQSIKATIKVSSTETGVIFGNIFYDGPATSDSHNVVLNDVHIDILDYINPAYCTESQFRSMWTEFEWENKVNVNTTITDLRVYLKHIMASTNMSCLTPDAALEGDCGFLSANMYARSLFGEDALANLSIEKQDGVLQGHIRIRSKTQGIALSLGDKVSLAQKAIPANA